MKAKKARDAAGKAFGVSGKSVDFAKKVLSCFMLDYYGLALMAFFLLYTISGFEYAGFVDRSSMSVLSPMFPFDFPL